MGKIGLSVKGITLPVFGGTGVYPLLGTYLKASFEIRVGGMVTAVQQKNFVYIVRCSTERDHPFVPTRHFVSQGDGRRSRMAAGHREAARKRS